MSGGVIVGIDYGELELRVAYAQNGKTVFLLPDLNAREPAILFDASRNISSLGVGFPSVLQSVGAGIPFLFQGRSETIDAVVQRRLADVWARVREHAGEPPGTTVLAVPASLSQRKRQMLLTCAQKAGFTDVSLVDRAIAVALGVRTDRDQSGTFVVFSLDYGACEVSLARLARGRCWIIGSVLEPRVSGERLDALIIEDIVLGLRDRQVFLGLKRFTPELWHRLRAVGETVRLKLASALKAEVKLNPDLTDTADVMAVRLDSARFAVTVRRHLADVFENIAGLLEQNQLDSTNVDAVLLVGDVATQHPVDNIVWDSYPNRVARTDENVICLGAVVAAADAAGVTLPVSGHAGFTASSDLKGLATSAVVAMASNETTSGSAQFSEVISIERPLRRDSTPPSPSVASTGPPPGPQQVDRLSQVRSLTEQGRYVDAEQLLTAVAREMEELRAELKMRTPTRPQQLLQQAQALVIDARYPEAVALAHQAFIAAPHDASVFSGMMKIHADAGLGLNRPEQYEDAIHILTCAYDHDQTDRTIHKALAERHYIHARAMLRLHNANRALEAAKCALTFEPKHVETNDLIAELSHAPEVDPEMTG
jgi:actin-like ATPase involved in cell morphogenesis